MRPACGHRACFVYWRVTGQQLTANTAQNHIDRANQALRDPADHITTNPHKEEA